MPRPPALLVTLVPHPDAQHTHAPHPDVPHGDLTRREALRRAAVMLGGTLSAPSVLAAVLAACDRPHADTPHADTPAPARPAAAARPYAPRTLTPPQAALVATIAEAVIPRTDTPGARDAKVHEFIDAMLTDYFPAAERTRFLAGLARVDAGARRAYGRPFVDCAPAQQTAVLGAFDRAAYGAPNAGASHAGRAGATTDAPRTRDPQMAERNPVTQRVEGEVSTGRSGTSGIMASGAVSVDGKVDPEDVGGRAFFRTMKELTLVGYYTSQAGATQELRVTPMGPYHADVPYAQIGRAWA